MSRLEDSRTSMKKGGFQVFSLNGYDSRPREYKKRKLHRKTNSGCLTCRAKRVKCDELKPSCARCRRNERLCIYEVSKDSDSSSPDSFSSLSAVSLVPFYSPSAKNGTCTIHLLQHAERYWEDIYHVPRTEELYDLSKSHPIVRNTILAISACHLRHMSPNVLQHRIAEHFQQSLALRDCQKMINTPMEELGQTGVNALLFSMVLLNIIAFALPQSEQADISTSWVFSSQKDRLNWLALQDGTRRFLKSTEQFDQTMVFVQRVFLGSDPLAYGVHDLERVPKNWIRLFADSHELRPAIFALSNLLTIAPDGDNMFQTLPFLSKVHSGFRNSLYERDERALWLFGYWLGYMLRFKGLWWFQERGQRDYEAIRLWLEHSKVTMRSGIEGEVWRDAMNEFDIATPSSIGPRIS